MAFFTFQSGSIQIDKDALNKEIIAYFTFQSGSIQICTLVIGVPAFMLLYIPIWFYSNR